MFPYLIVTAKHHRFDLSVLNPSILLVILDAAICLVGKAMAFLDCTWNFQKLTPMESFSLTKAEFVQTMMATSACLHYEPGYQINKPLLLMVGDKDATGNIRKVMPLWAKQELDCRFVVISHAKHAANLDNPGFFYRTLMDFLTSRA